MDQSKRSRGSEPTQGPPSEGSLLKLSQRKEFGRTGESTKLLVNSFLLRIDFNRIHQYSLVFQPEVDSFSVKRKLLSLEYLKDEVFTLAGDILWMKKKLSQGREEFECVHPLTQVKYRVKITYVKTLAKDDLREQFFLYNNTFRKLMKESGLKQMGRSHYDPSRPRHIHEHNIQLFPGFTTAISKSLAGITLSVDLAFKIVHSDNILVLMEKEHKLDRKRSENELIGAIVYVRLNHQTYRIDDIAWDMKPTSTFKRKKKGEQQETEISFYKYYEETYSVRIRDMHQPLLVTTTKRRQPGSRTKVSETIFLVPELCYRTGLPDSMISNFQLMKSLHSFTRVEPEERVAELEKFIKDKFVNSPNPKIKAELDRWGMSFPAHVMELPGRMLPAEELFLGNDQRIIADMRASWDMKQHCFLSPITVGKWIVVAEKRDQQNTEGFLECVKDLHKSLGMTFSVPPVVQYVNRFEEVVPCLLDCVNPDVKLAVVVLPGKSKEKYNAVKELMTTDRPVPCQCVVSKTISDGRKLRSVCTKIIQQLNSKLGGELWRLNMDSLALGKAMIVGIDVAHDKSRGRKSFVGFCATTNKNFNRYYCRVNAQPRKEQEIITTPRILIKDALQAFYKSAGSPPESIIVYRDGVGDSQINGVLQNEVSEFLAQFDEMKFKPKFTFIVVQKKTTARFFRPKGPQLSNPPPGTVIDRDITSADFNDFYMVNQHVNQGSVSPTRYIIVHDSSTMGPDIIQRLTFKLSHLYFNWPGTISVPAPVKYAHKLCHLISQATHKEFHHALNEKLFFL